MPSRADDVERVRYTALVRWLTGGVLFVGLCLGVSACACTTEVVHDPAARHVAPILDEPDAQIDEDAATPEPPPPVPDWALEDPPPPAFPPPD